MILKIPRIAGIGKNVFNLIKNTGKKPVANIIVNDLFIIKMLNLVKLGSKIRLSFFYWMLLWKSWKTKKCKYWKNYTSHLQIVLICIENIKESINYLLLKVSKFSICKMAQ